MKYRLLLRLLCLALVFHGVKLFSQCCPPAIIGQPQSQIVGQGNNATFTVTTATSSTFQTFDWRFNGSTIPQSGTAGGTISSLTITNVQFNHAGNYSVVINNAAGSATSENATLTVVVPPANDDFVSPFTLTGLTNSANGSNLGASGEPGEPNHAGFTGGKSVWWSWTAPASGNVSVTTFGSSFDTLLAVYTGSPVSSLTLIANNDQAGGGNQSAVVFSALSGTTYEIAVDGYLGDAGNISLNIAQPTNTPVILTQPVSQVAQAGNPVLFSVDAGGLLPLRYQWHKDGAPISGATNASYFISTAQTNQAGNYTVVVTNTAGAATSSVANLTVFAPEPPANDTCNGAVGMTTDTTYFVDTTAATSAGDFTPTCAPSFGRGVWYTFTPSINGVVTISTCGTAFDTVLQVYTGSCGALTIVIRGDDNGPACSPSLQASVSFNGTAGTTYRILAGGYGSAAGILNIVARLPPPNDNFANRIALTGPTNSANGTSVGASKELGEPAHAGNSGGKSVWWSWTAPASGNVAVTTFGSSFDTLLAVYTGPSVSNPTLIASNDDAAGGTQSGVVFSAVAGTVYQIAVDGYFGDSGNISLNITQPTGVPVMLVQPTDQTVFLGGLARFTAVAGGATPVYYQWRNQHGVPIPGETNTVMTLNPAQYSDAGLFSVSVSNSLGTIFSTTVLLTVNTPAGGDLVSFNPAFSIDGPIEAIAVQPNGKILIGGDFTVVNGIPCGRVARLNANGTLDQTFITDFAGANGTVISIAVQTNGTVLIGGSFSTVNGLPRNGIARLNADGSLDTSFQNGMAGTDGAVYQVVPQADGKVLIGGTFVTVNGIARLGLARLDGNGSLDTGFMDGLPGPNNTVTAIALQPEGKVLIGGVFTNVNGQSRNLIARLDSQGNLDNGFQNGMSGVNDWVFSIAVQSDGKVLMGGLFTAVNGVPRNRIARLNPDGSLDTGFQNGMSGADNWVYSVAIQTDGRMLLGGLFTFLNGTYRGRIARLNLDGSVDTTFQNGKSGANALVRAVTVQPDGKVVMGGDFTTVNDGAASYFARLYGEIPALRLAIGKPSTNGVPLRVTGLSGLRVVLQASANLANWFSVTTNTLSPIGGLQFTDPEAANVSRRYFRALLE